MAPAESKPQRRALWPPASCEVTSPASVFAALQEATRSPPQWLQSSKSRKAVPKAASATSARNSRCAVYAGGFEKADAIAFIFCASQPGAAKAKKKLPAESEGHADASGSLTTDSRASEGRGASTLPSLTAQLQLPALDLFTAAASLLPALALRLQPELAMAGVTASCLPIVVPFSVPQVSEESWMANKRARAFHRCCVIAVYTQGALAILKFASGNLIGGIYDGLNAAMGAYAIQPEGLRFFPTYLTISGFNGLIGCFQIFQAYNGVPLHAIPKLSILPPILGLASAYWGWQFCREVKAIAVGLPGLGPQDTCFVRFMSGDWCSPLSPLPRAPTTPQEVAQRANEGDEDAGNGLGRIHAGGFRMFGGDGHRLGECGADSGTLT
mmetsp:Transcript_62329/g.118276  ORF Transcript_62329/g.118276 Transcript_62329/m.118276 type:complete len:384 (-) Transcript_62329:73-1224(-)